MQIPRTGVGCGTGVGVGRCWPVTKIVGAAIKARSRATLYFSMVIPQFLCEFWAENLPHGIKTQNRLNAADSNAEKPGLWPGFSTLRLVMVCDPIRDRQIERRAFERIAGDVSRLWRSEYQKAPRGEKLNGGRF
jgi:hypothetical protein